MINNVTVVRDGVEAMAYLRKQEPYSQARHPDIILLDLNLPRKDGREVLAEIKSDETFENDSSRGAHDVHRRGRHRPRL